MPKELVISTVGQTLRALITAAGYRAYLVESGLDKNLDDLAGEAPSRQSTAFDVMQEIEDKCSDALANDIGYRWAEFLRQSWFRTKCGLQELSQNVDCTSISDSTGNTLFKQHFIVPMLSGFMNLCCSKLAGGPVEAWLEKPLKNWTIFATKRSGLTEDVLLTSIANGFNVDQRSIERWLAGAPIGKITWPYAEKITAALTAPHASADVQFLSGWLLIACALQSIPPETREEIRKDVRLRKQQPWNLKHVIQKMNPARDPASITSTEQEVVAFLGKIQKHFAAPIRDDKVITTALHHLQGLIDIEPNTLRPLYQYVHDWFSAHHAAHQENEDVAITLYTQAVANSWWRAGPAQHPILNEALMYAVGVGDKDKANAYWDKTFMLGLNQPPKRPLDVQEVRRIAFGFEQHFFPQKAKIRIPPVMEFRFPEDAFRLNAKHLSKPNQKTKYAEGRTRRTPLMVAIQEGTLDEVKQLISTGGDLNDFVAESGEGPLSYAMRRACDRKDTIIMDYILGFDLEKETVNRAASTKRETPLKIAIEMANPHAASRLIALGADVEAACCYSPSALCYAMLLFHGSLHRNDTTQQDAYFAGKIRGDVYDAKEGAVLDIDLADRRQYLRQLANASPANKRISEAVWDYFIRSPDEHREVIQTLLAAGADANRGYRVHAHDLEVWTPTLFAAEVGDLAVFKMLVEHGGNIKQTLMPSGSLECFDAMWVAIAYDRHSIVSYLMQYEHAQQLRTR